MIVTLVGIPSETQQLRVSATLGSLKAEEEFTGNTDRLGMWLPEGGSGGLLLTVTALAPSGCAIGEGMGGVTVEDRKQTEIQVRVNAFNQPRCSCQDGRQNGTETDVDCGGAMCAPCGQGQLCSANRDCQSKSCIAGRCVLGPMVSSIAPALGPTTGGTQVRVNGSGFQPGAGFNVTFGGTNAQVVSVNDTQAVVTLPPRLGQAGKVDVVVNNDADVSGKLAGGFAYYYGNPGFTAPLSYLTGSRLEFVAAGDLNSDKIPDVVVADAQTAQLRIFKGVGDGSLSAFAVAPVAGIASGVVLRDFNNDGGLDAATTCFTTTQVNVLRGNNDLTLRLANNDSLSSQPYGLLSADFNRDGRMDLATTHSGGTVTVLINNGTSFTPMTAMAAPTNPTNGVAGDVTGDDIPDLIVNSYGTGALAVYPGVGNGTFKPYLSITAPGATLVYPVIADFNGDGRPDLAANSTQGSIHVFLGQGGGAFNAPLSVTADGQAVGLATADLNLDGRPDLVSANPGKNTVSVLLNKGDGSMNVLTNIQGISGAYGITTADLNGDGRPDLIVSGQQGTLYVLRNSSQ